MGGRSLGWGARVRGRRMSGEMKVGGRVEEMSFFYFSLGGVFLGGGGGFCLDK